MKALISRKFSTKILISGIALTAIGFVSLMINAFNAYSKAYEITSCPRTSSCGLSSNLLVAHIGIVVFWIGLALTIIGAIARQRSHK